MLLMKERAGKLLEALQEAIYKENQNVNVYKMLQSKERFENVEQVDVSSWDKFDCHEIWGGDHAYFWFYTEIVIPKEYEGACVVYELKTGKEGSWDATNPQFLAYINGKIKQGLDVNHRTILLSEQAKEGDVYKLMLLAYTGDHNFNLKMDSQIKIKDMRIEKFYYDIEALYQIVRLLQEDSQEYIKLMKVITKALNLIDLREIYSETFYESLLEAQNYITTEVYDTCDESDKPTVYTVGHTHIDVAWMWTLDVTKDKAVRSFSTVLEYMKQYPDYIFMSSQPQLYKYVKELAPEIYEQIKERIAQGRWEAEGAMFVEADCNLSSGESFIRQIYYGKKFFREEFGKESKILWLPDVFGYSAALPQIMQKCGIRYFMTTKISWNEFNKMPYDTFEWEGMDGSKILTHFIPSRDFNDKGKEGSAETEHFTTYNGMLNPSQVKGAWQRYSQKELNEEVLMSFGYGDGGGGPTEEMLQMQSRLQKNLPGCPNVKSDTALHFFEKLEESVKDDPYLPKWVGELYLEYHRGTYTSMARNKKYNRRCEFALLNLEFLCALTKHLFADTYSQKILDDTWEIVMRNQFHDILPGSSIEEVYVQSKEEYEQVFRNIDILMEEKQNLLSDKILAPKGSIIVLNQNAFDTNGFITLDGETVKSTNYALVKDKEFYPMQQLENGNYLAKVEDIPSKGFRVFELQKKSDLTEKLSNRRQEVTCTVNRVETPFLIVRINEEGCITKIYDKKEHRELLPKGCFANELITYEDRPHNFDAWDINHYYTQKSWKVNQVTSMEVCENGPLRYAIKIERTYLESIIVQYLYFYPDRAGFDIRYEIDWKEKQILLRNYFPFDIHAQEATYEIQYGNVKRPTHRNTSWDFAKFEVCAHKWIDLSEDDYGVSVLNDCKYGCDIHDGVIGLTLLKSAIYPNPLADKEKHEFMYSFAFHKGDYKKANTMEAAYLLNNPLIVFSKKNEIGDYASNYSFVQCNSKNVMIEVIKDAYDGDGIILRLYEAFNRRTNVQLTFAEKVEMVSETDMLENEIEILNTDGERHVYFEMKPFEIKTIKVRLEECK